MALLSGLLLGLARRALRAWQAAALVALVLGLYAWLVGGSASVVRATLMAVIGLSAERIGRRTDGVRALSIASLLMAAWDPGVVWDVGHQLSAGATLGLILYTDPLQKRGVALLARVMPEAWAERVADVAGEGIFGSLSAQITTLPLILFYFQNLSLAALPANALILPPQPAVMVVGGVALLASVFWLPLGQAIAWLAWPFTAYTIGLTELFAKLPLAALPIDVPGPAALFGYYAVLATATWLARQPAEARPAWLPKDLGAPLTWTTLTGASAVALWGWTAYWRAPEPATARITILALGTGSASLIELPDGGRVLLDVGPPGLASSRALDAQLPPFDRRLTGLLLDGIADEQLGALPDPASRYRIDTVWASPQVQTKDSWLAARPLLAASGSEFATNPGRLELSGGAALEQTDAGPWFNWGAARVPWIRTPEPGRLHAAQALIVPVELDPLTLSDAILATNPRIIVLLSMPVAPTPELELVLVGRTTLALDRRGNITLVLDGQRLWVETVHQSIKRSRGQAKLRRCALTHQGAHNPEVVGSNPGTATERRGILENSRPLCSPHRPSRRSSPSGHTSKYHSSTNRRPSGCSSDSLCHSRVVSVAHRSLVVSQPILAALAEWLAKRQLLKTTISKQPEPATASSPAARQHSIDGVETAGAGRHWSNWKVQR